MHGETGSQLAKTVKLHKNTVQRVTRSSFCNTVDAALLGRRLSGAAVSLVHFGQERNHANSSA